MLMGLGADESREAVGDTMILGLGEAEKIRIASIDGIKTCWRKTKPRMM